MAMATDFKARPRAQGVGAGPAVARGRSGEPRPVVLADPSAVERAQRGRLIVEVAAADLEFSEEKLGAFHPTTEHFRRAHAESLRGWERLRAEMGTVALDWTIQQPPRAAIAIGSDHAPVVLILIDGQAYRAEKVAGTELAPLLWKLDRLRPALEFGPYFACRLLDGGLQCDCAGWYYRDEEPEPMPEPACKHLAGLRSLGWI